MKRSEEKKTNTRAKNSAHEDSAGFTRFWEAWPAHKYKRDRQECVKTWESKKLERLTDRIVAHVDASRDTDEWSRDGGQFIPAPLKYLRNARWETAIPVLAPEFAF